MPDSAGPGDSALTEQPLERQPTRVNILRRLSNLSTAVPKDGLLLISFAGHGMERGGQAFLLPADAQISDQISFLEETAISINRVKERIKETGVDRSWCCWMLAATIRRTGRCAECLEFRIRQRFQFRCAQSRGPGLCHSLCHGHRTEGLRIHGKKQGYFSWAVVEGLKGGAANEKAKSHSRSW